MDREGNRNGCHPDMGVLAGGRSLRRWQQPSTQRGGAQVPLYALQRGWTLRPGRVSISLKKQARDPAW